MKTSVDTAEIELSEQLLRRVSTVVDKTEFKTKREYIEFVLHEVIPEVDNDTSTKSDSVNEEEVKDRLESLGYLNE